MIAAYCSRTSANTAALLEPYYGTDVRGLDLLSAEELKTIFDPFRRGAHKGQPGTGLGLAIARRAVEAQGGRIAAESNTERGCHFWFTLPKARH